jgi:nucleoid DNA-binding protein
VKKLTKEALAREVREVLGLEKHTNLRASPAYKLVGHILDTITSALRAGESVLIPGFGEFQVRRPAPMGRVCTYFYGLKSGPRLYRQVRRRPYVHFHAHKPLVRFIHDPAYAKSQSLL